MSNFKGGYQNIAACKSDMGEKDSALFYFHKAAEYFPDDAAIYANIGVIKDLQGKRKEGLQYHHKAISINPEYSFPYANIAGTMFTLRNYDSAEYYCRYALSLNPNQIGAYNVLGLIKKGKKEYDSALFYFRKTLEMNPRYPPAYSNIGSTKEDMDELDSALFWHRKYIEVTGNEASGMYYLGFDYLKLKDYARAKESFDNQHRIDPNNQNKPWEIGMASWYGAQGKTDEAVKMIRQACKNGYTDFDDLESGSYLDDARKTKKYKKLKKKYGVRP